jgi:hypothetical protein
MRPGIVGTLCCALFLTAPAGAQEEARDEQPPQRNIEFLFGQQALTHGIKEPLRIVVVRKKAHASFDRLGESLRCRELLHPERIVRQNAGVGIHIPFESHASAKKPRENRRVIGSGHSLELLPVGRPPLPGKLCGALVVGGIVVVAHDRARSSFHSGLKRRQLILEKAARRRIHGPLAPIAVRIEALVDRSITGKMFNRLRDRLWAEGVALEAEDELAGDVRVQLRALPKRSLNAVPPRFGRDVHLIAIDLLDSGRTPLGARDFGEGANELQVVCRRQAERAGPAREHAGSLGFFVDQVVSNVIPWIRCKDDGNAEPRSLCDLLRSVRAFRQLTGTKVVAQDQIVDVPLIDVVVQRLGVEGGDLHQTGFFLEGHSRKQIRHALADRQAPIFVRVEYAVSVQILEREIPNFQQGAHAVADASLLGHGTHRLRRCEPERDDDHQGDGD